MLLVKTYVDKSNIEGLGLFADEFIPKGKVVWEFNQIIDKKLSQDEIDRLPEITQDFLKKYSYLSVDSKKYILGYDHDRFFNHQEIPNTISCPNKTMVDGEVVTIARIDINIGDELTSNYKEFDMGHEDKLYS